jgi:hypothetical protein
MTIETGRADWRTLLRAAGIALAIWMTALLVIPFASELSRDVTILAIGEDDALRAITLADVDILEGRGRIFIVRGRAPGFVSRLYASGGIIVLAGNGGGCGIVRQR